MDATKYFAFSKYISTAAALKLFSIFPGCYRFLGNKFGMKRRLRMLGTGIPDHYGDRAKLFISMCNKYNAVNNGDDVIEIGTGWVHFESIVLRLFYDVKATLFDVWDNRQLEALKQFFIQLEKLLHKKMDLDKSKKKNIKQLIHAISTTDSLDDLYNFLSFQYVIDPSGTLDRFGNESFQMIYSCNVLEHIDKKGAHQFVKSFYRLLKPGGFSVHRIDLSDHLVRFAGIHNMLMKNYLKYSDKVWKIFFENRVQYINRIQCSEWLSFFEKAGFEVLEKKVQRCEIDLSKVAKMYKHLRKNDLECESIIVVHRKPA